jgi:hypothetical protein
MAINKTTDLALLLLATNQTNEITRYSAQLISNLVMNQSVINDQIIALMFNIKNVILSLNDSNFNKLKLTINRVYVVKLIQQIH